MVLYVLLFKCVPYSKCVSCHQWGAHRRVNIINQDCQVSVKIFSSTTFQKLQALLQAIPPSLSLGLTVVTESTKKPTKAGWHYEDTAETHHALPAGSASFQPHTRCYTAQKSWALEKGDTFRHTICYKTICWHLWSMFKLAPSDNAISNCLVRFFSFNNYVRRACMGQKKKSFPYGSLLMVTLQFHTISWCLWCESQTLFKEQFSIIPTDEWSVAKTQ